MSGRWEFSDFVRGKARRYLDGGKVSATNLTGVYLVQGSARRPYVIRTDANREERTASWIQCSCPHGDFALGRAYCSHAVAVLLAVLDGRPLPVKDGSQEVRDR